MLNKHFRIPYFFSLFLLCNSITNETNWLIKSNLSTQYCHIKSISIICIFQIFTQVFYLFICFWFLLRTLEAISFFALKRNIFPFHFFPIFDARLLFKNQTELDHDSQVSESRVTEKFYLRESLSIYLCSAYISSTSSTSSHIG